MKIKLAWQDNHCVGGDCEAFYDAPGGMVVQGKLLDDATRAQLQGLGTDEDAVFVSASLIAHLKRH